jgi:hypothetical protein
VTFLSIWYTKKAVLASLTIVMQVARYHLVRGPPHILAGFAAHPSWKVSWLAPLVGKVVGSTTSARASASDASIHTIVKDLHSLKDFPVEVLNCFYGGLGYTYSFTRGLMPSRRGAIWILNLVRFGSRRKAEIMDRCHSKGVCRRLEPPARDIRLVRKR